MLHRGRWLIIAAYFHVAGGEADKASKYLDEARALAKRFQASRLLFELGFASVDHWMKAQDLVHAMDELSDLHELATKAAPAQRAEYAKMMTRLLLLQGRLVEGLQWSEEAMRIALTAGYSGANLRAFEMELVYALAANDCLSEAAGLVSRMEIEPREHRSAVECCLRFLLEGEKDSIACVTRRFAKCGTSQLHQPAGSRARPTGTYLRSPSPTTSKPSSFIE